MDDVPLGIVENEFAAVRLSIDSSGNGPRLRIEDLKTGQVGYLDALELETLAWASPGLLKRCSTRPPSAGTRTELHERT